MQKCANCGSRNTQTGIDTFQCLDCGALTNYEGEQVDKGLGATTRDELNARANKTYEPNLVGNIADLQRLGAAKAPDPKAEEFKLPPGVSGDEVTTTESKSKK